MGEDNYERGSSSSTSTDSSDEVVAKVLRIDNWKLRDIEIATDSESLLGAVKRMDNYAKTLFLPSPSFVKPV